MRGDMMNMAKDRAGVYDPNRGQPGKSKKDKAPRSAAQYAQGMVDWPDHRGPSPSPKGIETTTEEQYHPKSHAGPKREAFSGRSPEEKSQKRSAMRKSGSSGGESKLLPGAVTANYQGGNAGGRAGLQAAKKADQLARKLITRKF